jgi:hypothetical protein
MSRAAYLRETSGQVWTSLHRGMTVRVSTALLKTILLKYGDTSLMEGQSVTLHRRSLGAGVYELKLQRRSA